MRTRTVHGGNALLSLLLLALSAGGSGAASAAESAVSQPDARPFLGRWDVTLSTPGHELPSWIEVSQGSGGLSVRMVGRWGHARVLPKAEILGNWIRFVSPKEEEGRANSDMVFEARRIGAELVGGTTGPDGRIWQWRGVQAPTLQRGHAPEWGMPVTLFNGKNLAGWRMSEAKPTNPWVVKDGALHSPGRGTDLLTAAQFGDFKLHIEFNCRAGANSGIYLRGRYEVQVEDDAVPGTLDKGALVAGAPAGDLPASESESLCGEWSFRPDPDDQGAQRRWHEAEESPGDWRAVSVPHTWQVEASLADYRGIAWYRRQFDARPEWNACAVRIEFEAVFHTATVWVNGQLAGEHVRKGYTAFTLDISRLLRPGRSNSIAVPVDGSFSEGMIPRKRSSDWAHDGGIYRPVQLLITPKAFVERVDVEALPDLASGDRDLSISAQLRNTDAKAWRGQAAFRIVDAASGLTVLSSTDRAAFTLEGGANRTQNFSATLHHAKWWHFDHPHLYQLIFSMANGTGSHEVTTTFGIRRLEARGMALYLNGERVRLMGLERMAGSNPGFGMAEGSGGISHDDDEMKRLYCVFTRGQLPQDRRVLDYCDQHRHR